MSSLSARIDCFPTHHYRELKLRPGRPYPFGATVVAGGINFSIFSRHATDCTLVLFEKGELDPFVEIPFRGRFEQPSGGSVEAEFRVGNVFALTVFDLDYESIEYGFRLDGPGPTAERGAPAIHRFDKSKILLDPYARAIGGRDIWGAPSNEHDVYQHRARVIADDFDWESDRPLEIPVEDLIIYELHVRGFTRHPSSRVKYPGTFAGLREKIPYLKELGVNCIELMPLFEFDELEYSHDPKRRGLMNYWGYSTVGFFSPKAGFAATGKAGDGTMVADELKTLVKELHRQGIEVMLDVVFNHTAEGNEWGPTISYRGIDNATYYMLTPDGYYLNFSGTGNTMNCNDPMVRNMVLDCLRYWVAEYHIDGFRFDLASILGRSPWGEPLANPPLVEILAHDPVLAKCKLVAEAWDAGGLYQVGSFPAYGRWAEWNGKYRDTLRKFIKGDAGQVGDVANWIQGAPNLYADRGPTASINFITCHDGFTLLDLFSYNEKHNEANGEDNRDGTSDNNSWNCGVEGPTQDPGVNALRKRLIKNAVAILMVSQGVPMILMGDELGRTKRGNNNTYCHDNELNWLDWALLDTNTDLHRFFKACIAFRCAHQVLRSNTHLRQEDYLGSGYADLTWHGTQAWKPDWSAHGRVLAFMLCGQHARGGGQRDDYVYVAMNMHSEALDFELPQLPGSLCWHLFANTSLAPPKDVFDPGREPRLTEQHRFCLGDRAVAILVGR